MQVHETPHSLTHVKDGTKFVLTRDSDCEFALVVYGDVFIKLTAFVNSCNEPL